MGRASLGKGEAAAEWRKTAVIVREMRRRRRRLRGGGDVDSISYAVVIMTGVFVPALLKSGLYGFSFLFFF